MAASDDTAPPDSPLPLERILASLDDRLGSLDERARHREAVIDRLHAENRELRSEQTRALFDPVVTDLVHLHDQLDREARGLRERGEGRLADLMVGFADDTLLALERIGVEPIEAEIGDPFRADLHRPLSTIDDPDPARANTVAEVTAPGFRDTVTGRIRRRVQARFFRHVGPARPEEDAATGKGT
ncbi:MULTISPECIES: nucleotide exchange factor GrpE [Nocardiopsis]|uniref:Nucleotide exchange factor GrpE n=1 Tax=Nocardiopsis lambiniae TaxID=3075539 RepID=A0ABU2M4P9_9ACTN|nr:MULTISPECIES: nucleotide exchange factor GrpE [unclassified Nocardiopsis]MDE3719921.1 nucleotide exchange factor GrpE [Nocardiopsis sp. N85]MDT0327564.1 nucleotide exchange factor GrpE [Nocardiopsis sp. DSM 44743]